MPDTNPIDRLANDIRAVDGDHKLGAGDLAEKLIELGWVHQDSIPAPAAPEKVLTLKDYKEGDKVEVYSNKAGDFIPGFVQEKLNGRLHVHTDKGPVTVQSVNYIRKA